ncbi:MAG: hypothetical protein F7C35_01635 [Desulfurococcales archaeon]|nr:hypothetical protein [Desulfurococcales archaeon]
MPRMESRVLLPTFLVILFYLMTVAIISATWTPTTRGDSALVLEDPERAYIAGAAFTGGPVGVFTVNNTANIIGSGWNLSLSPLRALTACELGYWDQIVVAGVQGTDRIVSLTSRDGEVRGFNFSTPAAPRRCSSSGDYVAVLFTDPVASNYLLLYDVESDAAVLVKLPRGVQMPSGVAVNSGGQVVIVGTGYYALIQVDWASGDAAFKAYNVTVSGSPVRLRGALFTSEGGLVLYGSAFLETDGGVRERAVIMLPDGDWLAIYRGKAASRVRGLVEPYPGVLRAMVEIVGKETDILDLTVEGAPKGNTVISAMAPYSLRASGTAANGTLWVFGNFYLSEKTSEGRKTETLGVLHIIRSSTPYQIGSGLDYTLVMIKAGRPLEFLHPNITVRVVEDSRLSYTTFKPHTLSLNVTSSTLNYRVYGIFVDRTLLACALSAVLALLYAPLAEAVYKWNRQGV